MRLLRSIGVTTLCVLVVSALVVPVPAPAQQTQSEKTVWKLEHAFWRYVKDLDLKSYRAL